MERIGSKRGNQLLFGNDTALVVESERLSSLVREFEKVCET